MSRIKSVKFRVTAGYIHSFRIRSKETSRVMYPKYPVFDVIQRNPPPLWIINLIYDPFFYFSKEMKYRKIPKINPAMNKPLQI